MAEHDNFVNSCCPLKRGPPLLVSGSDDGTAKVRRPDLFLGSVDVGNANKWVPDDSRVLSLVELSPIGPEYLPLTQILTTKASSPDISYVTHLVAPPGASHRIALGAVYTAPPGANQNNRMNWCVRQCLDSGAKQSPLVDKSDRSKCGLLCNNCSVLTVTDPAANGTMRLPVGRCSWSCREGIDCCQTSTGLCLSEAPV